MAVARPAAVGGSADAMRPTSSCSHSGIPPTRKAATGTPRRRPPDPTGRRAPARHSAQRRRRLRQEPAIDRLPLDPAAELHLNLARPHLRRPLLAPCRVRTVACDHEPQRAAEGACTSGSASISRSTPFQSINPSEKQQRRPIADDRRVRRWRSGDVGTVELAAPARDPAQTHASYSTDACARTASGTLHTSGGSELAHLPPVVGHHRDRAEADRTVRVEQRQTRRPESSLAAPCSRKDQCLAAADTGSGVGMSDDTDGARRSRRASRASSTML